MIKYRKREQRSLSIFFAVVIFFGASAVNGYSGEIKSLTWAECVRIAEMNNPDILSAREGILQVAASKNIVRSDLLPQISASASGARSYSETAISGGETSNSFYYGLSAKQLIFDGFKSVYELKSAGAELESAKLNYRVKSSEVRYKLRSAYIDYIKAKEMLKIAEEIQARRKHIYDLVKLRYNAGKEHVGSLHSTEADLMQAKADSVAAARSLSLANTTLCHLLGYEASVELSIDGTLDIVTRDEAEPDFSLIASNTPAVLKASSAKNSAYYSLKASELDYSPKLYGNASIGRRGETMSDMSDQWSVGFEVTAPLFEGGRTYYSVSKASAAHRQTEAEEKSARNSAMSGLRESWNTLETSLDTVDVQKLSLKAVTERSNIGEMQYSIGTLSFDNWTIIENNLAAARKSYINACASSLLSEAAWIQSKGGTLENENKN
jgi:outer membrane protein TolC